MWQARERFEASIRLTPEPIDPEWLSDTIGVVYDCVLQPGRWSDVMEAVCSEFSFIMGGVGILRLDASSNLHEIKAQFGGDPEWIAAIDTHAAAIADIWGRERILRYPLDEPIIASHITPAPAIEDNAYYRNVLSPRGVCDSVGIGIAREARLTGYMALSRHVSAGPVGPRELEGLRLLGPHMRRAATISNLLGLKAVEGASLRAAFDGMASAVVLVDDNLTIVHANRAGEAMLAAGEIVHEARGRLVARAAPADSALANAVRLAGQDAVSIAQRGIGVPASAEGSPPAVFHVMPLTRGLAASGQRAVAAIFIVSGQSALHTPVDAIATLYEFTPAESQIFALISGGTALADAADMLGIAKSTAKTHLMRVFDKTGAKRQAELVALAGRLSLSI